MKLALISCVPLLLLAWSVGRCGAAEAGAPADPFAGHPAAGELAQLFAGQPAPPSFQPTGLKRADYLALIAANVDFFRQHQNSAGAIIDPVAGREIQYSTPAFALAAAEVAVAGGRADLLDPAAAAMRYATSALAAGKAADGHGDFYIPMLIHARRLLRDRVPADQLAEWDRDLRSLVPERVYKDHAASANWNIVNVSGEALRRHDGLVAPEQAPAQMEYLEKSLARQAARWTKFGMYLDPNAPLAYDAFPRLWLEDLRADGAYRGAQAPRLEEFLRLGSLSTLLLLSPTGEWACGGRSAQHQWNEAEIAVIAEIEARRWQQAGRADVAGACKRAAHLAFASMRRWQRPSGELWIVKNRAEPVTRHGYEGYSSHSQYNLLPVAMLALAYERADDAIAERPIPAEAGGYVFDLRETFHKVAAAAGGTYVLIDTAADPHYNATGLQRVHVAGVLPPLLSDSAAAERAYGPKDGAKAALAPGLMWQDAPGGPWHALAEFALRPAGAPGAAPGSAPHQVRAADLQVTQATPQRVACTLAYQLEGPGARAVTEEYVLAAGGVEGVWRLGGPAPAALRVCFPALVSDGAAPTDVRCAGNQLTVRYRGATLTWTVASPLGVTLRLDGPQAATHNGLVQAAVGDVAPTAAEVRWRLTLEPR